MRASFLVARVDYTGADLTAILEKPYSSDRQVCIGDSLVFNFQFPYRTSWKSGARRAMRAVLQRRNCAWPGCVYGLTKAQSDSVNQRMSLEERRQRGEILSDVFGRWVGARTLPKVSLHDSAKMPQATNVLPVLRRGSIKRNTVPVPGRLL